MKKMTGPQFIIKYRRWFIFIPLILSLLLILPLRNAKINTDLNSYFPENIPAKINQDKLEEIFGSNEPVILFIHADDILAKNTLERIRELNRVFSRKKEISRVISPFSLKNIRSEEGSMVVDPAVKRIPSNERSREKLRTSLRNNDMVYGTVISDDFRYALIILFPAKNISDRVLIRTINEQLQKFPGKEEVFLNGTPFMRYEIQRKATRDLAILLPIGLLIMTGFLYFSFREIRGVILPLSIVIMSTLLTMGLIPLLGWDYSIIAVLVPIMMLAIANNYGVHIISRYQELNAREPGWQMSRIVTDILNHLTKPITLTALTTIIGVLGMAAQIMLPAKQMGIVSAIGIFFALILSLTFLPAILSGMKKGKVHQSFSGGKITMIDRILKQMVKITTKKPVQLIILFGIILIISGIGIIRLKVSISNEKILPASNQLRISNKIADTFFGGTRTITLMFEGDIKSPGIMKTMDRFEKDLLKMPEVGQVTSLATVIRIISRALNNRGDSLYDVIPGTRNAIAQYIELYSMSGDPDDFEQLVNFDYTKASLNVQFRANDRKSFNRVISKIDSLQKSSPYCTLAGGFSLMEKEMSESIVRGQIYSLFFALLAIAILLAMIFRSVKAGFMGSLPLLFTIICNFGLMGWLGIELDIATSLLSSIAIGIGVDYTIHLFWRLKSELAQQLSMTDAIKNTLITTGRGITINALSVILGFAVLFISALTILKTFAFLIIFSLILCLLCALVLIPSLCMVVHPHFLENTNKNLKA